MEKIKSLTEFIEKVELLDLFSDIVIFRGQPIKGSLLPGIARVDALKDTTEKEKETFKQLKLLGASHLPHDAKDLDVLVIGQHFGLKTRLLDWTSNPLIALWFACSDGSNKDSYVYALDAKNFMVDDAYSEDPFSFKETRVFQPRMNNPRIIAQSGWFTLHRHSATSKKFVPLEHNKKFSSRLKDYCINAQSKPSIISSLMLMGISHKTIYPDLGGLCAYLNTKDQLMIKL